MKRTWKVFLALLLAAATCLGSLEGVAAAETSTLLGEAYGGQQFMTVTCGTGGTLYAPSEVEYASACYTKLDDSSNEILWLDSNGYYYAYSVGEVTAKGWFYDANGTLTGEVLYYITVVTDSSTDDGYNDNYNDNSVTTQYQTQELKLIYGAKGTFSGPTNVSYVSSTFAESYYWNALMTVDDQGNYQAKSVGDTTVIGKFYDASNNLVAQVTYDITIAVSMSGVKLNKTSQTTYVEKGSYDYASYEFKLKAGTYKLSKNADDYTFSCTSSNSSVDVGGYMEAGGKFVLYTYGTGKTKVTVTINGKNFKVTLKTVAVSINKTSMLLVKGKTGQLKIKGVSSGIKWSSTNSSVVKVSSGGKIRAVKVGNAVIKAKIGNLTVGCVVSVAVQSRYKAVKQAIHIAATSEYSQAKRMQNGYYDCSSLVWRGYKSAGVLLGGVSYAPTAAALGEWCVVKKKTISGGLSDKNVQSMKLNAGDLMFETGADNGRYKGIYHVEMITGYYLYGFDSKGKPMLGLTWASRGTDYYGHSSSFLVGRP